MKHLKTYELFLGGGNIRQEVSPGFDNYLIDSILRKGIFYKKDEFETVEFEIPSVGKITLGNFEWLGDVESFKQNVKLEGMPYVFRLNNTEIKVDRTFNKKVADTILKTIE